ncbi:MAG: hypothetical protein HY720_14685 [Planctomycetes bacterium]|nr:hypothetical protein [Planctomycetota bacterium]
MLAGPDSTLDTMKKAVWFTIHAFDSVAEIDIDRTPEDKKFFLEEKAKLEPFAPKLKTAAGAIEDHELGPGMRQQARVELGDAVQDRGVRDGNAKTKAALRNKPGLPASHVFGRRVSELTEEKLRLEPQKVLQAAGRLEDVPDFPEKPAIKADLVKRATKQESLLAERDKGWTDETQLDSAAVRLRAEAADALARAKAALDGRFPRQRGYVSSFFLDVGEKAASKKEDKSGKPLE